MEFAHSVTVGLERVINSDARATGLGGQFQTSPGSTLGNNVVEQTGLSAEAWLTIGSEDGNQPYQVRHHTYLEFEFKSPTSSSDAYHVIGWSTAEDSSGVNKFYQLKGDQVFTGASQDHNTYTGSEWQTYRIKIGDGLQAGATWSLARLLFNTGSQSVEAKSSFQNFRVLEDIGYDGGVFTQVFATAEHSLSSIHIDYKHYGGSAGTIRDDRWQPSLWINGQEEQEGWLQKALQKGDTARLTLTHNQPTNLVSPDTPSDFDLSTPVERTYDREAGQILTIGLEANQYSRQHLTRLAANLNDALLVGGAGVDDIDELQAYTNARYWYDFNRSNEKIGDLTQTVGIQQWVGSGLITANSELYDISDESYSHLQFPILPVGMGIDLPNANHVSVNIGYDGSASSDLSNAEAFQLVGWNASALENAVLERVINTESVSTIRGLKNAFDNAPGTSTHPKVDGLMVFERVTEDSQAKVYWRGNLGRDVVIPDTPGVTDSDGHRIDPDLTTANGVRTYHPTKKISSGALTEANFIGKLKRHEVSVGGVVENPFAKSLWDQLNVEPSEPTEDLTIRIVVPYLQSVVGAWGGSVNVAETVTSNGGQTGSYAITAVDGLVTQGGFSGGRDSVLELPPALPEGSFTYQTFAGDPVSVANGNMFRDEVDFRFPNLGLPLDFTRHYDSQNDNDVGFGVGWVHAFTGILYLDNDGDQNGATDAHDKIVWLRGDGSRHTFEWVQGEGTNGSSGEYKVPSSLAGRLIASRDGDGALKDFEYRDKNGVTYVFDTPSFEGELGFQDDEFGERVVGRLRSIYDRHNTELEIDYSDSNSVRVTAVQNTVVDDTVQRELKLVYDALGVDVQKIDRSQIVQTAKFLVATGFVGRAMSHRRLSFADLDNDGHGNIYRYYKSPDLFNSQTDQRLGLMRAIIEPGKGETHQYEYFANRRVFRVKTTVDHMIPRDAPLDQDNLDDDITVDQAFSYDLFRNVAEFTDENGSTETYYHRDDGLLSKQQHEDGSFVAFVWGDEDDATNAGLMLSSTDEVGATESFEYFGPYKSAGIDPSKQDAFDYRRYGELKKSTAKDGVVTEYEYFVSDFNDRKHISELEKIVVNPVPVSAVTDPLTQNITTTFERDDIGDLTQAIDPLGNKVTYTRHARDTTVPRHLWGLVESQTQAQSPSEAAAGAPLETHFEYDSAGNVVSAITDNEPAGRRFYDHHGNVVFERDATGVGTQYEYNARGQLVESYLVPNGDSINFSEVTLTDFAGQSGSNGTATSVHEILEGGHTLRLIENTWRAIAMPVVVSSTSPTILEFDFRSTLDEGELHGFRLGNEYIHLWGIASVPQSLAYEAHDGWRHFRVNLTERGLAGTYSQLVFVNDDDGDVASGTPAAEGDSWFSNVRIYDETAETDDIGLRTYTYYPDGRIARSKNAVSAATNFLYDARGKLVRTTAPNQTFVTSEYDDVGNRVAVTDALGNTTRFVYDSRNRLTQTIAADGSSTRTQYDGAGRVVKTIDPVGSAVEYTYDEVGRQLTSKHSLTYLDDTLADVVSTNHYDNIGRLEKTTDAEGNVTEFKYDKLGRVIETRVLDSDATDPDTASPLLLTRTFYNGRGEVAEVAVIDAAKVDPATVISPTDGRVDSNNEFVQVSVNTYDPFGRLVKVTNADETTTRVVYDDAGRPRFTVDELGRQTETEYDEYGRLLKTILPDPDETNGT